jgi:hypothetical protein
MTRGGSQGYLSLPEPGGMKRSTRVGRRWRKLKVFWWLLTRLERLQATSIVGLLLAGFLHALLPDLGALIARLLVEWLTTRRGSNT